MGWVLGMAGLALLVQAAPANEPQPAAGTAEVRGRLLLAEGEPAEGTAVLLEARSGGGGDEEPWNEALVVDADGRFSFVLEPPEHASFALTVRRPGFVEDSWRWVGLAPGEVVDLGDVELRPAGGFHGRVLAADGRPIEGGWTLTAEASEPITPDLPRRGVVRGRFEAPGTESAYQVYGLPAGECRLVLDVEAAGRVTGPVIRIVPGVDQEVDFVFDGPDLNRRIHVELAVRPVHPAYPAVRNVRLFGPDARLRFPLVGERSHRSLEFDGLDPDSRYTLEIDDPDFELLVLEGLAPGNRRVQVTLTGNAAVLLLVEDGRDREVIEDFDLHLLLGEEAYPADEDPWLAQADDGRSRGLVRPGRILLRGRNTEPLVRGRVPGLVPGDHVLLVRSEGLAPARVPVPDLAPGEERFLHVTLVPGGRLAGRVTAAGAGRAGLRLQVFDPGDEARPPLGYVPEEGLDPGRLGSGYERLLGVTGPDGAFELGPLEPGPYVVRVRRPDGGLEHRGPFEVVDGETTELELELESR